MINVVIDGYDFYQMEPMKYWNPPAIWSKEKSKTEVINRIYSGEWIGARKYDGAWYSFQKDMKGNCYLRGRSRGVDGDFLNKIDNVPHIKEALSAIPNGTVLVGEIVFPDNEGSKKTTTIMGCLPEKAVARQKENPISYYIFDALAWNGKSLLWMNAAKRFHGLSNLKPYIKGNNIMIAEYVDGDKMWEMLQEILANDGEGMVFTRKDALYEPGKRPSKTTMKVKQALKQTIDFIVIGANPATQAYTGKLVESWIYWYNVKTDEKLEGTYYRDSLSNGALIPVSKNWFNGWCGSWKIGLYDGPNLIYWGDVAGLTDEEKANWRDYMGSVVEIGGMQIDKESKCIRHPKLLSFRIDKNANECTTDQLI